MPDYALGTEKRPLRVAIMGSGPSGFYAAEHLLSQEKIKTEIDMYDSLPTPFGLVRGGVAPDHAKIKSVVKVYEKTAARNGFEFLGNVQFGKDVFLPDLKEHHDAIIFATGAKSDRRMGVPGEDLEGNFPATDFVGWYNGHPDYADLSFDLSCEKVAVVGIGNVAMDVTRILARDPSSLQETDIAGYALEALRKSKIKEIYLLGRRGPAQAAFTNPEIRELGELPGADLVIDPKEVDLDDLSRASVNSGEGGTRVKGNIDIMTEQSKRGWGQKPRKIHLKFLVSPVEVLGEGGKATAVKIEKNKLYKDSSGTLRPKGSGEFEVLPVSLIFRSIGYMGVPLPDIPFDQKKGTIPNQTGRIVDPNSGKILEGLYVAGWAKRGPSGVIGTNKPDSIETANKVLEDFQGKTSPEEKTRSALTEALKTKKIKYVTFSDWKKLDELEIERGKKNGKIREKFPHIAEMISALEKS